MARRYNPFACCPVCGVDVGKSNMTGHRCSKAKLAAIDAVHKRFENAEGREDDYSGAPERPLGERLAEGFRIMSRGHDDEHDG